MNNPQKITTVRTQTIGDGLGLYDSQRGKTFVLNATTSLVWQHCDGKTTPRELAMLLQRTFNVPAQQADGLLSLALDELESAALLQRSDPRPSTISRRQVITRLATAGLSLVLMPIVTPVVPALADSINDDDRDCEHHHRTTTRPAPSTTTHSPTTKPTTTHAPTTSPSTTTHAPSTTTSAPTTSTTTPAPFTTTTSAPTTSTTSAPFTTTTTPAPFTTTSAPFTTTTTPAPFTTTSAPFTTTTTAAPIPA